ncbi:MAG: endonuclease/exonuclease/phosphatase family protein [Hyphomicrobiaceae bacterium]
MRLVSYNIQYGFGRDGRYDLRRAIDAVAGADIIALQEVERHWRRTRMDDQPALIGRWLSDRYWTYAPALDVDASTLDAAGRIVNRRRQHGQMIVSRWPILSSRMLILPKLDTGPTFNFATGALEAVIAAPVGSIRVYNVHLGYVSPEERKIQASALCEFMRRAPEEGGVWTGQDADPGHWQTDDPPPPMPRPAMLMGDFNSEADDEEMRLLAGAGEGLIDAWQHLSGEARAGVTFRADPCRGVPRDLHIDHVLVTSHLAPRLRRCWIDATTEASDHQPVWVELD